MANHISKITQKNSGEMEANKMNKYRNIMIYKDKFGYDNIEVAIKDDFG